MSTQSAGNGSTAGNPQSARNGRRPWPTAGFRRFFSRVAPDVVGLLLAQGEVSVRASATFLAWSSASGSAGSIGREESAPGPAELAALEQEADGARRTLLEALRGALATPIDQEDLYLLSERCDRVVNALRDVAAEAEALGWRPDSFAEAMASHVHAGMGHLVEGFAALHKGHGEAGVAADRATAEGRAVAYVYRDALRALLGPPPPGGMGSLTGGAGSPASGTGSPAGGTDSPAGGTGSPAGGPVLDTATGRELLTSRELYRSYARLGELVVAVADRLWYAVLAEV